MTTVLSAPTNQPRLTKATKRRIFGGSDQKIHKAGNGYVNPFGQQAPWLGNDRGILALKAMALNAGSQIAKATQIIGTPGGPGLGAPSGTDLAVFVPQDLRRSWSAVIASQEDIVLTKLLPTVPAFSTQIEWVVKTATGGRALQTHFMSEAGPIVGNNKSVARSGTANVALFGDRRTLSTVSQIVGLIGGINPGGYAQVSRDGLQVTTADMIREQVTEYERFLFFGDSAVNDLEFDGVVTQIRDNGTADLNVHDMAGTSLTFERFLADAARLGKEPTFARIEVFIVSDETYASLQIQASDTKRWVQGASDIVKVGNGWTFNPGKMQLIGPRNNVIDIKIATFLSNMGCPAYSTANVNEPADTMVLADLTSATATGSGTAFAAGNYRVGLVAAFLKGASAGFYTNIVAVGSGQQIDVVMNDSTHVSDADNPLLYWWVYLTDDTGAVATLKPIGRVPAGNVSGHTEFSVDYSTVPGSDVALGLMVNGQGGPGMFRAELLPSTRFPIPYNSGLGTDMVICNITTPVVAHYEQQLLYTNIINDLTP